MTEMWDQDNVNLVTGYWVREEDGKWIFDSVAEERRQHILLNPFMEYEDLVKRVKDTLRIVEPNVTVKLSYQYPPWMQIDDGDGSTPQFISDDHDVEEFVLMRRKIEEVNLFVTISVHINEGTTGEMKTAFTKGPLQPVIRPVDDDGSDNDEEVEEEWLEFAMSETPLTCPYQKNDVGGTFAVPRSQTIPNRECGIVIREPILHLASPPKEAPYKGKGKAIARDDVEYADGMNVHITQTSSNRGPYGGNEESSRAVRRRLFDQPFEPDNGAVVIEEHVAAEAEPIDAPNMTGESGLAPHSSLYTWTRFANTLHDLLNDESSEPVLFARDAPPVIDRCEADG